MKYCGYCGAEVLDEAIICPKCGYDLTKTDTSAAHNFCAHCGKELAPDVEICPNCGCAVSEKKVEPPAIENVTQATKDEHETELISMIFGIVAIATGVLGIPAIVGIVLGSVGYHLSDGNRRNRSLNIAGLAISCITCVIGMITFICYLCYLSFGLSIISSSGV